MILVRRGNAVGKAFFAFDQGHRLEGGNLLVAFGQPLAADAFAQTLDLFLGNGKVSEFVQIDTGLAKRRLVGAGVANEVENRGTVVAVVDAQRARLREEGLATLAAVAMRFGPFGLAGARLNDARFGVSGKGVAAAGRTLASVGRRSGVKGGGLSRQQRGKEVFLQRFAQENGNLLQAGEGGAPGGPLRAIKAGRQIFHRSLKQKPAIFYLRRLLFVHGHPWLLERDASNLVEHFLAESTTPALRFTKPVVRPTACLGFPRFPPFAYNRSAYAD